MLYVRGKAQSATIALYMFLLFPLSAFKRVHACCRCCMSSDGVWVRYLCLALGLPVMDVGMCLEALRKKIYSDLISVPLPAVLSVCLSAHVHRCFLLYMLNQQQRFLVTHFRFEMKRFGFSLLASV